MKGALSIRDLYESFERATPDRRTANRAFTQKVLGLVKDKKLALSDFDIRELWEGLVVSQDLEEDIHSSAFPTIAGEIVSATMIQAYDQYPKLGLQLVRVVPSRQKISQIVGWTPLGKLARNSSVREKEDFPELTPPDEKTVKIKNAKNGFTISLTKEAIFFDKTGQLLRDCAAGGAELARWQDEVILNKLIDTDSDAYDGGAMFSASAGIANLLTGAGSALGTTGYEACRIAFRKKTDEKGKKINIMPDKPILMHGADLEPTVLKLLNNEFGPIGTAAQTDYNVARNGFVPFYNPYLSSTTAWFYGDFKNCARWEEVWPLETFAKQGQMSEDGFKKDVIAEFKASIYGGCGFDDFRRVYKNAGA